MYLTFSELAPPPPLVILVSLGSMEPQELHLQLGEPQLQSLVHLEQMVQLTFAQLT